MNVLNMILQNAAVHYQLAQIYIKAGDMTKARNFSRTAHLIEPDNVWYATQLASIYQIQWHG